MALRPSFSWEINLGHVIQVVLIIAGFTVYEINAISTDKDQHYALVVVNAKQDDKIERNREYIDVVNARLDKVYNKLDDMINTVGDLKAVMAGKQDRR